MTDFQSLYQQARQAAAKGDYQTARQLYSKLWESPLWRNDKDVRLNYAYCCERVGDYSEALAAYKALMELYTENAKEGDEALAEESMVRLREMMADAEQDAAVQIVDRGSDASEAIALQWLFTHGYSRSLAPGDILCSKGDPAAHMWLLTKGTLEVLIPGVPISKMTAAEGRPCLLGELAFFTGMRRAATLCSAGYATVIELPFERITALLDEDDELHAIMDHLFRHRLLLRVLSKHDIFKRFNEVDRRHVTKIFENSFSHPGQVVVEQNQENPCAYMVQSGTVLLIRETDTGEELIGSVHPGDLFHLGGVLRGFAAPYKAVAGTPCHLLRLCRSAFEPFMLQRPWLVKAILQHSRLAAEQQILHSEAKNIWDADRQFDLPQDSPQD